MTSVFYNHLHVSFATTQHKQLLECR